MSHDSILCTVVRQYENVSVFGFYFSFLLMKLSVNNIRFDSYIHEAALYEQPGIKDECDFLRG